jgi:hypothetical protein
MALDRQMEILPVAIVLLRSVEFTSDLGGRFKMAGSNCSKSSEPLNLYQLCEARPFRASKSFKIFEGFRTAQVGSVPDLFHSLSSTLL